MLIGFEAKRFFKNYTGLGNYSRFIINALSEHYPENQYFLYTPTYKSHPEVDVVLKKKNIEVVCPPNYYPGFTRSLWRTWGISRESSLAKLQIFHGLSQELPVGLPGRINKIVTVHDLIYLRYPEFYNSIDVKIYTTKVKHACKQADRIIAISHQTADDIVNYLNIDRAKIDVIYQGCHPIFKKSFSLTEIELVKEKYGLPEQYFLNVGTIEPRKNALLIAKALLLIPEKNRIPVVIAGKATKYTESIKEFISANKLSQWVRFLHDGAFADFPALYQGAQAFIYPSLFEGFGIPLVEAIESKVPVITSTGSSFTEAAGPGAIFNDPADESALAKAMIKVVEDARYREHMITTSTGYIQRFQPTVIAAELISLYNSMIGSPRSAVEFHDKS